MTRCSMHSFTWDQAESPKYAVPQRPADRLALHVGHAHGRVRMSRRTADNPDQLERARMALGLPASADRDAGEPGEDLGVSESRRLIAASSPCSSSAPHPSRRASW